MGWKRGWGGLVAAMALGVAGCGDEGGSRDGKPQGEVSPGGELSDLLPTDGAKVDKGEPGGHLPGAGDGPQWAGNGGSGGTGGTGGFAGGQAGNGGTGGSTREPKAEVCDDGLDNDGNHLVDCDDWACGGKAVCDCDPGDLACEVARLARFWAVDRFFINGDVPVTEQPKLAIDLLAKAEPDECYDGLGGQSLVPEPDGSCPVGIPKTNQAYVWGLTHATDALWFGTVANTHCLVLQGFLGIDFAHETSYWACEFGADGLGRPGDWRRPEIWRYDLATGTLEEKSGLPILIEKTIGLRSAGFAGGVVFLAGPTFTDSLAMFAFDAATGDLLGAHEFAEYSDIRTWVAHDGELYAGVAAADVLLPDDPAGFVLKWVGDAANPFLFEEVGALDTEAANLAVHEGRLFVTTWPSTLNPFASANQRGMGLYRSPPIPAGGLTAGDAENWDKIWEYRDYDPDPIAAAVTGGGALASFEGKLYWGSMHVPFLATAAALQLHEGGLIDLDADGDGSLGALELAATALGSHRSISIFRGEDLSTENPVIKTVYGEKFLPTYDAEKDLYTIRYDAAHGTGSRPVHGSSGVGNFFNAYTWAMQEWNGSLYIGTFDWSQLARVGLQEIFSLPELQAQPNPTREMLDRLGAIVPREGADLFRFDQKSGPFVAESLRGVGNFTNYGVRTMAADDHALYLGMANPMNLHPDGGWELLELTKPDKVKSE